MTDNLFEGCATTEEMLQRIRAVGGLAGDTAVGSDFTEGWAIHCWVGSEKAHYYRVLRRHDIPPGSMMVKALCMDRQILCLRDSAPLFGPGNFPRCQHCLKKAAKRPKA